MKSNWRICFKAIAGLGLGLALGGSPASGLIVQSTGSVGTLPSDLPLDAIGKWGNNAAAVAVAPGWVLTTRHQDSLSSPPDRNVVIDGVTYLADTSEQITFGSNIDLRLVPIYKDGLQANLTSTVEVYGGSLSTPTTAVLTGFGPTIGTFVAPGGGDPGGYNWAGTLNANNGLNVGQNNIDSTDTVPAGTFSGMDVLVADFDQLGTASAVDFEATGSFGDSGGTWFINDGGTWKLVGLTHAIQLDGDDDGVSSTTNDDFNAQAFFGQDILAVDARAFATTINTIPEPTSLALLGSAAAFLSLRRRRA